jgi:hypothetical protein
MSLHRNHVRAVVAIASLVAAAALIAWPAAAQTPLGTSFTYQGRLTDAGNPASGTYDLQFALFDAASGGAQVGTTLTRDDVVVSNGLFTVSLDFGTVFAGNKRWLELGVRPGASTGAFTTLAGRQELNSFTQPSSPRPPLGGASRASRPASRTTRTTTRSAGCPARTARSRSGTAAPGPARPTPTAAATSRRSRPGPASRVAGRPAP